MNGSLNLDAACLAIIENDGHMLVTGGPGSGKTTVALLKARKRTERLPHEQSVLFLSFSRAAVQQVKDRMRKSLSARHRKRIDVSTYHLFCLRIIEAHGRLLNGRVPSVISPAEELLLKALALDGWDAERARLAREDGRYCFDLFAPNAATLLERSTAITSLYCSRYPLIILDEFQDTDNDQWRLVQTLARGSEVVCLADPEQRIFDYRGNIDPARLEQLRERLVPLCFDLGTQNHRSPQAGILDVADAVLTNGPLPKVSSVRHVSAPPAGVGWASTVHAAVVWLFAELRRMRIADPSVAVFARTNALVSRISGLLREEHTYNGRTFRPVPHEIVWDAELSAAAGQVIASIMEWGGRTARDGACRTLDAIAEYYRLKNAEKATRSAARAALDYTSAARAVSAGDRVRKKAPRLLAEAAQQQAIFIGVPVDDWRTARTILVETAALEEIAEASRMLRLFRASDVLTAGLQDIWVRRNDYVGATTWLRRTLDQQRLLEAERPVQGTMLMNMHKSKGKEFDGVVLVEASYYPLMLNRKTEERRLLRVAITRARHRVVFVRPRGAPPLTGAG